MVAARTAPWGAVDSYPVPDIFQDDLSGGLRDDIGSSSQGAHEVPLRSSAQPITSSGQARPRAAWSGVRIRPQ